MYGDTNTESTQMERIVCTVRDEAKLESLVKVYVIRTRILLWTRSHSALKACRYLLVTASSNASEIKVVFYFFLAFWDFAASADIVSILHLLSRLRKDMISIRFSR
jgi:hypothetical protein